MLHAAQNVGTTPGKSTLQYIIRILFVSEIVMELMNVLGGTGKPVKCA